jgi:hypothetical protein
MRKFILLLVVAGFVYVSVAQKVKTETETKSKKVKTEKLTLKEHVCNAGCKNGKHNLMHGEKKTCMCS